MTDIITTRITSKMAKDLGEIEKEEKTCRAIVVRKLLARAIADWKLERALNLYCDGKVTLQKAAKISGLTLWEMMEIVKERKISLQYTYEDFRADFEAALEEK